MSKLNNLKKVNDSFTINRYDNGWMIEITGKDTEGEWITVKTICSSEEVLVSTIKKLNSMELDS